MAHASLAERFAYGTPADDVSEPRIANVPRAVSMLVARILIAAIFLVSGFAKLFDHSGTVSHMEQAGIPAPDVLAYVAGAAEVLGGLAVLTGFLARVGALGLVVLLAIINVTMHAFWKFEGEQALMQNVQFMKNLSIMGGLLLLFAAGPGPISIDAKLRKPLSP